MKLILTFASGPFIPLPFASLSFSNQSDTKAGVYDY